MAVAFWGAAAADARQTRHAHGHPAQPAALSAGPSATDAWPELKSDLKPDPDTLFGVLHNGMRYALKRNVTPPGAVSVRLRMAAGSLDEMPQDAGVAHFIEHMTFRGTTHIADGDAMKKLEALGLTMEADVNAFTSPSETFFTYDLPRNDTTTLESALMLLRETASEVRFDPAALDSERQVILAERRARESTSLDVRMADEMLVLGDAGGRVMTPIGSEDVIRQANSDQLRRFYATHYRPENATLIIVGDIDPKTLEARIRAHFADWHATAPGVARPALPLPALTAPHVALVTEPGAPSAILYSWARTTPLLNDSRAREHADLLDVIGLAIFNEKLAKLAAQRVVPILAASASHLRLTGLPDIYQLNVTYGGKGALAAMGVASKALSEILRNGVTQAELDRSLLDIRTLSEQADIASKTTPTPTIANMLLKAVDQGESFMTPQQAARLFQDDTKTVTTDQVAAALRSAFSSTSPYVLVAGSTAPPGGAEAVSAALREESTGEPAAAAAEQTPAAKEAPWPYQSFGTKGSIVSRQEIPDLGITTASFANGVRATIKPTTFRSGQVLVAVTFGHGRVGLPKTRKVPVWALPATFPLGGLKLATYDELSARFATNFIGAHFSVGDDTFELAGSTRPQDFDTELQLLSAYISDPGWHADALDKARAMEFLGIGQAQGSPEGVLSRNERALLHGDDPRWSVPDLGDVNDAGARETRAIVSGALDGPLDVTVVGDITIDQALNSLAKTLGALPQREPDKSPVVGGDEHFAAVRTTPLVLRHDGNATQAAAEIDWQTTGLFPDLQQARSVRVLEEVLLHRLYDELRTREGIAYSPQADVAASLLTPNYGYLSAASDVPPDKTDLFYAAVGRVVDDLKSHPISDDELSRARDPRISDLERDRQTNEYWLGALLGIQSDPRRLDAIRTTVSGLKSITAANVQQAAQVYLRDDRAFKIVVLPNGYISH
jgi:zinc protease